MDNKKQVNALNNKKPMNMTGGKPVGNNKNSMSDMAQIPKSVAGLYMQCMRFCMF